MKAADTIAALATPPGRGALAIVRISGPGAFAVWGRCVAERKRFEQAGARRMVVVEVRDPDSGEALDQAMAARFVGPHSYTGEDMVEIFTHGGESVPSMVLAAALKAGARQAEPGEFSRRAVMHGKMDLLTAEAVDAMIRGGGASTRGAAIRSMRGEQRRFFDTVRERLREIVTRVEADLEFDAAEAGDVREELRGITGVLEGALARFRRGSAEERRVVIAGEPNAGKSTLFNALVGGQRALVDSTAGTTRDYVAERGLAGGVQVVFVDTAGFGLEEEGVTARSIERSWEQIEQASVVVWVSSAEQADMTSGERQLPGRAGGVVVGVVSKCDLAGGEGKASAMKSVGVGCVEVSLVSGEGRRAACDAVGRAIADNEGERGGEESLAVVNARQEGVVARMVSEARAVLDEPGVGEDALAFGVGKMLEALEELTGGDADESILDAVFSRFCIGK